MWQAWRAEPGAKARGKDMLGGMPSRAGGQQGRGARPGSLGRESRRGGKQRQPAPSHALPAGG